MRYEYIGPFVASTIKVLDNVIQTDITQGEISLVMPGRICIVGRAFGGTVWLTLLRITPSWSITRIK